MSPTAIVLILMAAIAHASIPQTIRQCDRVAVEIQDKTSHAIALD